MPNLKGSTVLRRTHDTIESIEMMDKISERNLSPLMAGVQYGAPESYESTALEKEALGTSLPLQYPIPSCEL